MLFLVLTDGKAGDLGPCLGIAERLADLHDRIIARTVAPRAPFVWLMPWGPADPRDAQAIAPPYPDIAIASGRRAVATLSALKKRSSKTFTVFLRDPRIGPRAADLIWVPEHDRLRHANVITSLTAPHRVTAKRLAEARRAARPELLALPPPRVAVLIGGPSKDVAFESMDWTRLESRLQDLSHHGASLMITPSRRTPDSFLPSLNKSLRPSAWLWDSTGVNPYMAMLALADAFVVTGDSTNMVGEAAATGKPIGVFRPHGLPAKIERFLAGLERHGAVCDIARCLETAPYEPLNSTPMIAEEIRRRYQLFLTTQKG